MKKLLLSLVFCLSAGACFSQTASVASIDELLRVAKIDQTMNPVMGQMDQVSKQSTDMTLQGKKMTPEIQQKVD